MIISFDNYHKKILVPKCLLTKNILGLSKSDYRNREIDNQIVIINNQIIETGKRITILNNQIINTDKRIPKLEGM